MNQPAKTWLLDTNIFIEAHKRHYAPDICPGFWECIAHYNAHGMLISLEKVKKEIKPGDALANWVKDEAPADLFLSTNEPQVQAAYTEIMQWVYAQKFNEADVVTFANGADGWLVAYAKVHGAIVVTGEKLKENAPENIKIPKIPNVCKQFGVPYQNTFEMLRALEVQFQWRKSGA